ncbi:DUF1876 family protein [Streptomyces sp. NBC_00885]|uniref:dsRBD fold-containing protein n=1 Tax=Streptomyces sp. NBC_00885 TaxID=2975857 RepID=UPI0038699EA6|nr:DUF1876 family protein [Streptomyces sp. NBC_00885]
MTRIAEWKIRLYPFEEDGTTKAGVVPTRERPCSPAKQVAHCDSAGQDMPDFGDELAASRAVHDLGRQMMPTAQSDISLGTVEVAC